ncbi:unnamed protein product [Zymoseptoria tritici ST99CH_1A5]|nr:unnamed protein product [Zymoseptoria tritici ST99CH_1E4]SMR44625.1 unnamed protein product [Zymoseptoria tritici ST99CH_3D1]SMY19788.1 unnamed protein product [Zymoseptoria tritici ST99CH_1A5]
MTSTNPRSTLKSSRPARSPESFDSLNERNRATQILQSYEKLSWISFQRGETIAQTRVHFQNKIAGFSAEDEANRLKWKEDFTRRAGNESKPSRKGKERMSSGGAPADGKASKAKTAVGASPGSSRKAREHA